MIKCVFVSHTEQHARVSASDRRLYPSDDFDLHVIASVKYFIYRFHRGFSTNNDKYKGRLNSAHLFKIKFHFKPPLKYMSPLPRSP